MRKSDIQPHSSLPPRNGVYFLQIFAVDRVIGA